MFVPDANSPSPPFASIPLFTSVFYGIKNEVHFCIILAKYQLYTCPYLSLVSCRCKAITDPQQLMFWAVEAAEDPDLAFRIISLAAIDVGIAALLTANIINTWPLRVRRNEGEQGWDFSFRL